MTLSPAQMKKDEVEVLRRRWGIEVLRQKIYRGKVINYVAPEVIDYLVELHDKGEYTYSLFICDQESNGIHWYTVCDGNPECYVEDFLIERLGLRWLVNEYEDTTELYEYDYRHDRDQKVCQFKGVPYTGPSPSTHKIRSTGHL